MDPNTNTRSASAAWSSPEIGLTTGVTIRLSTPVRTVEYSKIGVEIHTAKGSFKTKVVVMAVPGGVLKARSVKFNPRLPDACKKAFSKLLAEPAIDVGIIP